MTKKLGCGGSQYVIRSYWPATSQLTRTMLARSANYTLSFRAGLLREKSRERKSAMKCGTR
jgi:hypothetical protein